MKISEFENTVFELEDIVIRIRASVNVEVHEYDYQRQAGAETSVTEWLDQRVHPKLNDLEVSVIDGTFGRPHGRTRLRTLRDSYAR
jgi:predicted kinase